MDVKKQDILPAYADVLTECGYDINRFGIAIRLINKTQFNINGTTIRPYQKEFVLALIENYPKWIYSCPFTYKTKKIDHVVLSNILNHTDEHWGMVLVLDGEIVF